MIFNMTGKRNYTYDPQYSAALKWVESAKNLRFGHEKDCKKYVRSGKTQSSSWK